ncbi:hypothetical protein F2P81_003483 [Scophthalmus maximus]|uniref:Uncharacterized protein n=1 Tax=Scophthalmus maximus TaxID=52904 RepID=A0A6A4TGK6_SCOMX|nr:hypothetical protein F2P81_003483 [Scophthalmus maximus]
MRHGLVERDDWGRSRCHSTRLSSTIGSFGRNPSPSPPRYQWQHQLEAEPRGRSSSSGGQFGKLSPYLFVIRKINDSHGCRLAVARDACEFDSSVRSSVPVSRCG